MKRPNRKWGDKACVARHKRDKDAQRQMERTIEKRVRREGKRACAENRTDDRA